MERGRYKFIFSLETVTFNCKKILQLIMQSFKWPLMSVKLLGMYN